MCAGGNVRQGAERECQIACRLEAILRLLFQTMPDHVFERARNVQALADHLRGILFKDRGKGVDLGIAIKGALAGEHLVKNCAKTEDVVPMIHRFAAQLLGRHVGHGSEDRAATGLRGHTRD